MVTASLGHIVRSFYVTHFNIPVQHLDTEIKASLPLNLPCVRLH